MSDLDFYKMFQTQTVAAYGDMTEEYPTVPTPPYSQTIEEITAEGESPKEKIMKENPVPQVLSERSSPTVAESVEQEEIYSAHTPIGAVPPGYRAAEACATCTHFCCCHCYKHDFPCHAHYVCDSYEKLCCDDEMSIGLYSEGYLSVDVATATEEELLILAEGWTAKGNVKSSTREKKAVLSDGRFPIFDKKSALSAIKLRGKAKTSQERKKVIRAAAKYAPDEAKKAMEEDKEKYSEFYLEGKKPTQPLLFALALNSSDAVSDSDADYPHSVYRVYSNLYQSRYKTEEGMYEDSEDSTDSKQNEPDEQNLSSEFTASVSVSSSAAERFEPYKDPIYQVAENRVFLRAHKENRSPYANEVDAEYQRLLALRSA